MRRLSRLIKRHTRTPSSIRFITNLASYEEQEEDEEKETRYRLRESISRLEQIQNRHHPQEFAQLILQCKNMNAFNEGKAVHKLIVRDGLQENAFLSDLLVSMYIHCGSIQEAAQTFDSVHTRSVRSWSRTITAFAQNGHYTHAYAFFGKMLSDGVLPNQVTLVAALHSCTSIDKVRSLHQCVLDTQCQGETIVSTALMNAYARYGDLQRATIVFKEMPVRDLITWTSLITAYAQGGHSYEALKLYKEMNLEGISPNRITFLSLLSTCTKLGKLTEAVTIHEHLAESGYVHLDMVVRNGIICMYDRCGGLKNAKVLFDEMPVKTVVTWTAMVSAYARTGHNKEAMYLFKAMNLEGEKPNKVTLVAISGSVCDHYESQLVHSLAVELGVETDVIVATALITMYGKLSTAFLSITWSGLCKAQEVFDRVQKRDIAMWNAMITAYAQNGLREPAIELFYDMQRYNLLPDKPAFVSVLSVLSGPCLLPVGRSIHSNLIERGFDSNTIVRNSLMNMYGKCGSPEEAAKVFESGPQFRNTISWNTIIGVYSKNNDFARAMRTYSRMQLEGFVPEKATFLTILYACTTPGPSYTSEKVLKDGELIRAHGVEQGYEYDVNFLTALVVMYAKCGTLQQALEIFNTIQQKDTSSWNALIAAYGYHGKPELARGTFEGTTSRNLATWNAVIAACPKDSFRLLQLMVLNGDVLPDEVTLVMVLSSCAVNNSVYHGRVVHQFAVENGYIYEPAVANAIIDSYSKCGELVAARRVLDEEMVNPDVVSWNALIGGCSRHDGKQGVENFRNILLRGYIPDGITLLNVLHACCHAGLVNEGCKLFSSMKTDYGVLYEDEHFGCVVDLLGRAGHLREAELVLRSMVAPSEVAEKKFMAWMSLLGSCKLHGDVDRGEYAAAEALEFDSQHSAPHVILSSVYTHQPLFLRS